MVTGLDNSFQVGKWQNEGSSALGGLRSSSTFYRSRIDQLHHKDHLPGLNLHLHCGNVKCAVRLNQLVTDVLLHDVCNFSAQQNFRIDLTTYFAQARSWSQDSELARGDSHNEKEYSVFSSSNE